MAAGKIKRIPIVKRATPGGACARSIDALHDTIQFMGLWSPAGARAIENAALRFHTACTGQGTLGGARTRKLRARR